MAVVAQHNFYSFDFDVMNIVLMGRSSHKKILERDNLEDYQIASQALKIVGMENYENVALPLFLMVSSGALF